MHRPDGRLIVFDCDVLLSQHHHAPEAGIMQAEKGIDSRMAYFNLHRIDLRITFFKYGN